MEEATLGGNELPITGTIQMRLAAPIREAEEGGSGLGGRLAWVVSETPLAAAGAGREPT